MPGLIVQGVVFQFSGGIDIGVGVGNLLQRTLQRNGVLRAAAVH